MNTDSRLIQKVHQLTSTLQEEVIASDSSDQFRAPYDLADKYVHLIRDQLGYYFVGLHLMLDADAALTHDKGRYILVAGTGEAGRHIRDRGFPNKASEYHPIGRALLTRQACICNDDWLSLAYPELPETRSQIVLPLMKQKQVIGALDIQSVEEDAFSEKDIILFQSLVERLTDVIQKAFSRDTCSAP